MAVAGGESGEPRRRGRAAFLGLLLVASGAAALAHETAWQRLWTPIVGAGPATTAAVVAGTLLGLAIGAAFGGRVADRARHPGLVFAWAEGLGAALGLAVPVVLDAFGASLVGAPATLRLSAACLSCALASAPLGASLPAGVAALAPSTERAAPLLAVLYALNTLGAVAGVALPTAFGFEQWGTRAVVRAASALQALVAIAAAVGLRRSRGGTPSPALPATPRGATPRGLLVASFLAGAAGLAVEIAWIRRLTPALGTTSYAFGTVLCSYLAAIALGTLLLRPRAAGAGRRPVLVAALAAVPVVALTSLVLPVSRWASSWLASSMDAGTADARALLAIRAGTSATLLLPVAAIGAAVLPWLVHAAMPARQRVGSSTGALFAWNAAGSALAALVAGLVLVPALGTAGTLRAAGAAYLGAAAAAARGRLRVALALVAALVAVSAAVPFSDAAGRDAVGATFDPASTDPGSAPALFFEEGPASTVVVRDRDGRTELWVDGKIVASGSPTDRLHLALLGHLPMLFHRDPRRCAVVGLGTGITAGAVASYAPERLDVFELERAVADAAEAFRPIGGGLPAHATLHVVDGRHGLAASREPYDVITSDPIHPAAAGSAELYTDEHYAVLDARLAQGGVVCQWLPLYELSTADIAMVLRTMSRRFDVAVFVAGPDLVLVGARAGSLAFDADSAARRIVGAPGEGLRALGLASPGRLLGLLVAAPRRVRAIAGEGLLNTDDRPVLEFASARSQYASSTVDNLALLSRIPADPAALLASAPPDGAAFLADVERSRRSRRAFARWMTGTASGWESALPQFSRLADEDPADRLSAWMRDECASLLALEKARIGERDDAAVLARTVVAREGAETRARIDAAQALFDAGLLAEARAAARAVLPVAPRSARAKRIAEAGEGR